MNNELKAAATDLKSWFIDEALLLWSTSGVDSDTGASYERLKSTGEHDASANVRVRVQARQIFVFSLATHLGWMQNAQPLVDRLAAFVERCGRHKSGLGYIHMLNSNYELVDEKQDLYDHAFHLLANIWRYRAFGFSPALQEAESIIGWLNDTFSSPRGGWLEGDYATDRRRQNPHMHLFEAFIAAFEATGEEEWLLQADRIFTLFEQHFYDAERGVLLEYFADDWAPLKGIAGQTIEPGHMMEWVWLLRNYSKHRNVNVDEYANRLYSTALNKGISTSGLLYDELTLDGHVLKPTKRCWPMTELIKASIAQARSGQKEYEEVAVKALANLKKYYLNISVSGAYIDQLDQCDNVLVDFAPASTLYHLLVAAAEAFSYLNEDQ